MRRSRGKRGGSKAKWLLFATMSAVLMVSAFVMMGMDERVLPTIIEIVEKTGKNKMNLCIDQSVRNMTQNMRAKNALSADDFYVKTTDANGNINSLTVNTILVNQVCSEMAVDISNQLNETKSEEVKIPVGAILGVGVFANRGPTYNISVLPVGEALVDYETTFEAVGINQVNFQLWLQVDTRVKVVNPLHDRDVLLTRKIALVNTVFSGEVPTTYLNNMPVPSLIK